MQTTVELQASFTYSLLPIIILTLLILILIKLVFNKKEKIVQKVEEIEIKTNVDVVKIKQKYLKKLNILENKINNKKISVRKAYQTLSVLIRHFVNEVTGIKVQNYTLNDIKKINMPVLYELIQEYYAPEFARKSLGNINMSLEKTREVIEKWK